MIPLVHSCFQSTYTQSPSHFSCDFLDIHPQRAFWRGGVPGIDGIFTPEEVLYGYEMGFVIAGVLFGIITNAMLGERTS